MTEYAKAVQYGRETMLLLGQLWILLSALVFIIIWAVLKALESWTALKKSKAYHQWYNAITKGTNK